ncbi:NAD(P)/FAD-dependent oxidoreductase [Altibacter lentus]|uniref:NAD(P)/FAD-dependent oxidoreductase n=1 Tax=Altibacter lentus TaxID=1223410 RepID=UPI00068FF811|nr:FAD-dependent oxidoreductase [Altibacter lentus]
MEYIVVGLGIAGISFCEQLRKHNRSFVVFDAGERASTTVSGGVFNPVVLKRFTAAWDAKAHLEYAIPFYNALGTLLDLQVMDSVPVYRILKDAEEQNNWSVASDKRELSPFLSSELEPNTNPSINAPYGFGKVTASGRIYPSQLLQKYAEYLAQLDQYHAEAFDYAALTTQETSVQYKGYNAKWLVFAEGAAARHNPFFPKDLLRPNKGEYLVVRAPQLQLTTLLKGGMFVIPLGNDLYKVGATYDRVDTSLQPTEHARQEIIS